MAHHSPGGLILLVEDNRNISEPVGEFLESRGFEVDYAADGLDAVNLATEIAFDVIVLDLMLPRLGGLEVCRRLRTEHRSTTPILMLTARDSLEEKIEGLEAGADDYLTKPFDIKELEARVRALIRRDRREIGASVLQISDLILDPASLRVQRGGRELNLAPIALKILTILMREAPRVVSRREIEQEIWGLSLPDSDTLRSHLYNLRKAVDRDQDVQLLHTITGAGYRVADLQKAVA